MRLLRPLLAWRRSGCGPHLTAAGMVWVEDPSNADRARSGPGCAAAPGPRRRWFSHRRAGRRCRRIRPPAGREDRRIAAVWPNGPRCAPKAFACLPTQPPVATRSILRAGRVDADNRRRAVSRRRRGPCGTGCGARPATLAGVRLLPAGRLGPGPAHGARGSGDGAAGPGSAGRSGTDAFAWVPRPIPPAAMLGAWVRMRPGCAGSLRCPRPCLRRCLRSGSVTHFWRCPSGLS